MKKIFTKKCERDFSLYIPLFRFLGLSSRGLTQSYITYPTIGNIRGNKMSDHLHDTFGSCEDCGLDSRLFGGLCEDCDEQMFSTFWTGDDDDF